MTKMTKRAKSKATVKFKDMKSKSNPKGGAYQGGGSGSGKLVFDSKYSSAGGAGGGKA